MPSPKTAPLYYTTFAPRFGSGKPHPPALKSQFKLSPDLCPPSCSQPKPSRQPPRRPTRLLRPRIHLNHARRLPAPLRHDLVRRRSRRRHPPRHPHPPRMPRKTRTQPRRRRRRPHTPRYRSRRQPEHRTRPARTRRGTPCGCPRTRRDFRPPQAHPLCVPWLFPPFASLRGKRF